MSRTPESAPSDQLPDLAAALRLFDETTSALEARTRRLEEVLTGKQEELLAANRSLQARYEEIRNLRDHLDLVMGAVASGVIAVDRSGLITMANPVAAHGLGVEPAELTGRSYAERFPAGRLLEVVAGAGDGLVYEYRREQADGEVRIIAAKANPLTAPDGEVLGAVEAFEDVTDLRRLHERLERADRLRALGEMAAGVAHEIRNPLNGIEGFASMLLRDLERGSRSHRYAGSIAEGVRHLNRTVTGLLEFTRPKEPQRRPCDPVELAKSSLTWIAAEGEQEMPADAETAAGPGPALSIRNDWAGGTVALDPDQIRQVLLNLLRNAVQAVREHGGSQVRLSIAAGEADATLVFRVEDDGPGVPTEQRQAIFTPFHTTKDSGTGLGLAVAHNLVGLHDGELAVTDSGLGGACFEVKLVAWPR